MTNPNPPFVKGGKLAKAAGRKSRQKPHDQVMREWLQKTLAEMDNPIMDKMCQKLGMDPKTATVDDMIRFSIFVQSMKGNVQAAKLAYERAWGKAKEHIQITGEDGAPIRIMTKVLVGGVLNADVSEVKDVRIIDKKEDGNENKD